MIKIIIEKKSITRIRKGYKLAINKKGRIILIKEKK